MGHCDWANVNEMTKILQFDEKDVQKFLNTEGKLRSINKINEIINYNLFISSSLRDNKRLRKGLPCF